MTLLDPFSAILTGAIAGPILVVLYFLKLRRRRLRVASTLLWQRAVQDLQVNEPFRWLRPSLLLFLQLLALALLAIAIGRPAIPGGLSTSGRVILLIDRSLSMNARDGDGGTTRFDDAIRIAGETLDELDRGASVSIITYAARPEVALASTTDLNAARRALTRLAPTDQPDDLAAALDLVGALTSTGGDESMSPEPASVILLSDGNAELKDYALAGAALTFRRVGPEETSIHDNLGITAVSVASDFNDPTLTRLFLRLQNTLDREVAATVVLTGPSDEIGRRAVRIPASDGSTPGGASLTFELDRGLTGLVSANIDRKDRLAADNTASVIITPAEKPRVLLVTPSEGDGDTSWVLGDFLDEMEFESLTRRSESTLADLLESGEIVGYDLAVFDRVDVPAGLPVPTMSFGASIPGYRVEHEENTTDRFTAWKRTHPIMRGLVLDGVRIARPAWFVPQDGAPPADELASGRLGPIILLLSEGRWRRLAVAFEPASSNWPLLDISYLLFLVQAVEFFTFETGSLADSLATTSRQATIEAPPGEGQLVLEGPVQISVRVPGNTPPGQPVRVSLGIPERAGVYTDTRGRPILAVNTASSRESALTTRDTVNIAGRSVATGSMGEGFREIWHRFVLMAAAVLTAEWLLFARRMKA